MPFLVEYAPDGTLRFAKAYVELGVSDYSKPATNVRLAAAPSGDLVLGGNQLVDSTTQGLLEEVLWVGKDGTPGETRSVRAHDCANGASFLKSQFAWGAVAIRSDRRMLLAGSYAYGIDVGTASYCAPAWDSYSQYDAFVAEFRP
jgi:hypothetical protein